MSGINIDSVKEKVNAFLKQLPQIDEKVSKLAEKAQVEKAYVALGIVAIPILFAIFFGYTHFLIDVIGFVYPAYASIKAIESPDKEDDKQWLTYWLMFSLFKIIESILDYLISFIPFYTPAKLLFLIWAYYPSTKGALVIYTSVIKHYIVPLVSFDNEKSD